MCGNVTIKRGYGSLTPIFCLAARRTTYDPYRPPLDGPFRRAIKARLKGEGLGSVVRGSLVPRFTCPGVHLSVLFVCYSFLVRVRHSKGPPLPGCAIRFDIRTFRSPYGEASLYYTAGQQRNTFYNRSAWLCYTAGQQRNTF